MLNYVDVACLILHFSNILTVADELIFAFMCDCYHRTLNFSKCDQNRSFLRIWSHLLKKSFMENFFCAVYEPITILPARSVFTFQIKFFVVSIYYHIFLNHFIPLVSYCTA